MGMHEKRTIKLPWDEVCRIISTEIEQVTGVQIQCKANVDEPEFWAVEFTNQHLSLPKFCQFIQSLQPTYEDWEYALVGVIGTGIKDMSMFTGEKIIGQNLHIMWEHRLIESDGLWLVGVTDSMATQSDQGTDKCKLSDDLVQAITVIADRFYGKEPSREQE